MPVREYVDTYVCVCQSAKSLFVGEKGALYKVQDNSLLLIIITSSSSSSSSMIIIIIIIIIITMDDDDDDDDFYHYKGRKLQEGKWQ